MVLPSLKCSIFIVVTCDDIKILNLLKLFILLCLCYNGITRVWGVFPGHPELKPALFLGF